MLEPNPILLLSQVATFLVALFIVWKFGWGPLNNIIRQRKETIQKNMEQTESARQASINLEKEYQFRLNQFQQESKSLIEMAKQEGTREREKIVKLAQEEAQEIRQQMQSYLKEEKKRALHELRTEVVNLSLQVSEKMLRETVKKGSQDKRLEEILDSLDKGITRRV